MRATTLLLTAALAFSSTAAFAQSSYNIVVEPAGPTVDAIINAPLEYDEYGVVQAQHFNADNLTEEEYQIILEEADRVRAYRDANGLNFESEYVYPDRVAAPSTVGHTTNYQEPAPLYQIELYEPQTTTTTTAKTHTVAKGDTLYNISKRYAVTIDALQSANGLYGNTIGLGQVLTIPSATTVITENTYVAPLTMVSTTSSRPVTLVRNVEPIPGQSNGVYAVLPKDTLYSISRRACVKVADLISTNGISNPNALQPGQRLTMPAGHCLN